MTQRFHKTFVPRVKKLELARPADIRDSESEDES